LYIQKDLEGLQSFLQGVGYEKIQQMQNITRDSTDPAQRRANRELLEALDAVVEFASRGADSDADSDASSDTSIDAGIDAGIDPENDDL